MWTKILKDCFKRKSLICLTLDLNDWETVIIGTISSFDDKKLFLDEVNPYGVVIRKGRKILFSKIKIISYNDIYGKDLAYLLEKSNLKSIKPKYIYINSKQTLNSKRVLHLVKNQEIISIFINDDYIIGIDNEIDDKYMLLNNFTYQGFEDGYTVFEKQLVTKIRYRGAVEQKISLLKELKK